MNDVAIGYRTWVDYLAGLHNRKEPCVLVVGPCEIAVTVARVTMGAVTFVPIDGTRHYRCHPSAAILRETEAGQ